MKRLLYIFLVVSVIVMALCSCTTLQPPKDMSDLGAVTLSEKQRLAIREIEDLWKAVEDDSSITYSKQAIKTELILKKNEIYEVKTDAQIDEILVNATNSVNALLLDKETELEIRTAYKEYIKYQTLELKDISLSFYYGEYNGNYLFRIKGSAPMGYYGETVDIGGYLFSCADYSGFNWVWNQEDGLMILDKAQEKQLIPYECGERLYRAMRFAHYTMEALGLGEQASNIENVYKNADPYFISWSTASEAVYYGSKEIGFWDNRVGFAFSFARFGRNSLPENIISFEIGLISDTGEKLSVEEIPANEMKELKFFLLLHYGEDGKVVGTQKISCIGRVIDLDCLKNQTGWIKGYMSIKCANMTVEMLSSPIYYEWGEIEESDKPYAEYQQKIFFSY